MTVILACFTHYYLFVKHENETIFQPSLSIPQLDLIIDLLGSPTLDEMRSACDGAKTHILRSTHRPPSLAALYTLSNQATHEAVHLLCRMLVFDPVTQVAGIIANRTIVFKLCNSRMMLSRTAYHNILYMIVTSL